MNNACNWMILFIANLLILGHYLKGSTISNQDYLLKLFGHSPLRNRNSAGQSHRTTLLINLIKEKNLLLTQIKSSSLSEQKIALDHLFHVKSKIRSLRKLKKAAKDVGDACLTYASETTNSLGQTTS